ncbi:MoaD/ThiS family protein [Cronobacter malonaticus]|uniref:host specificity factor TipJ family phage tail protein n=1 Tax=Cronobacter malonaticus TaxID=413503 RepID=UPI0024AFFFDE|nr:host specificity factor TipJ family phage tail protein [Cronobacter malonaticus]ELY6229955.1 MoaD/ThiS family protein [Cronobacter malonaticus]MDI7592198.1 host specificity factor TipJ family phage tail protein [Cronobacter malonaticus]MDK1178212.1 host specificity factor TipJ family phage tail protein [Cronobacter malonaticus]MDK1689153.1 host specificity factor TipJ family phage tail protein [Cronobacter malonaticus]
MALIELSRFPGTPKERYRVPNGTLFYDWLAANDATFHRDLLIFRNGVKLSEDDELAFELSELDKIQIFDQPKGIVEDILSPIFKVVGQVFSFLAPKPAIANTGGNSVDSPNNSLTGQTNTARVYKAKPDIYGQIRSFPDLIQESLFEYVRQSENDGGLKYVTEWMCVGIGKYDYESVRYSESSLGSMAGAEYQFYQPGETIPAINEGYSFDDVDGQEIPGPNESDNFPVETASANTVVSGNYAGGQISMKIVKQTEFDYFMGLVLPHAVTFTINVTYNTSTGSVTKDALFSGVLISAVETNDGAVTNPVRWYTFTMNQLSGPPDIPAGAKINTTKFILNDNEALVVGPFFSPVESRELWLHTQSSLGGGDYTDWKVVIWKIDDNYNQIPGTQQTFVYHQGTPHDSDSEVFYRTDKIRPAGGFGKYAINFQRTNNSNDHSILKVEEIHAVNVRSNVVHPTDTLVRVKVRATENALGSRDRKYNALVTRHTISYKLDTQEVDYTLRPSRSFADAVAHTWLIMGQQPVSSIDLYGLYSIAESLPDERLGYFDYTFDDENDSLGDRVQAICNAASVVAYWDDGVLTFTRDQKVDYPAAVFNRANMKTDEYKMTYEATLPGGYDGVQVSYVHPTTNNKTYINYRVLNGAIVEQEAENPNKLEIVGFRNEYQARERAMREVKRLIYSRVKMNAKVFEDGIIQVGSVIQMPDIYDSNQQQGYITGRAGNNFDTSEPITFSGSMYVLVTDSLGNPTLRYPASPRTDTKYGFTAAIPNIQLNIWNGDTVQLPSRYLIATVEELDSQLWTVNSIKPNTDNTVSLTVSEYSDSIYS